MRPLFVIPAKAGILLLLSLTAAEKGSGTPAFAEVTG